MAPSPAPARPSPWTASVNAVAHATDAAEAVFEAAREPPLAISLTDLKNGSWAVEALYADEPDRAGLARALRTAGLLEPLAVARLPDRDWVREVQSRLHPVRAGRYFVHGAHDRHAAPPSALAIEIEAQAAFGTGHHESTRGCLLALEGLRRRGTRVRCALDIGTGSGVLAIAVARTWRAPVLASDMDGASVPIARANARLNSAGPAFRVVEATGFRHPDLARARHMDLVLANILARPNIHLAGPIARALAPGGHVVLSGHLLREERRVLAAYRARGLRPVRAIRLGEWSTLVLARPKIDLPGPIARVRR